MLTSLFHGLLRRTSLTALLFAFLSIAAVLFAPAILSTNSSATNTTSNTQKPDATRQISAAMSSLRSGQGPLGIGPMSCSPGGSGSVYCSGQIGTAALGPGVSAWTPLLPSFRALSSMVYDAADGYVILFGGTPDLAGFFGDTWKYVGGTWTNITTIGPSPRADASMAYDAADGYVVLFGGLTLSNGVVTSHIDTWRFLAGSWTNITSSSGPSPRGFASMTYDAADGYVVLFGGESVSNVPFRDTWKFLSGTWTNITSITGPSPRVGASTAYDAADRYLVLFGGASSFTMTSVSGLFHDTWKFLGGSWTNITSGSGPSPRLGASMVYDRADSYVLLFSGEDHPNSAISDTWKFLGGTWTNITAGTSPNGGTFASIDYYAADGYVLCLGCGGISKFLGGSWTIITDILPPLFGLSMAYDAADGYVVLFGGQDSFGFSSNTWKYLGGSWTKITSIGSPPSRYAASMAYDAADGYVILFGGASSSFTFSDTWKFSAGIWTNITSTGPSPRDDAGITYDAADGYVLLVGGFVPSSGGIGAVLGDTWKFSAGIWTQITSAAPLDRVVPSMAYDTADGYVVLFGGGGLRGWMNDTWRYSAGTWTNITSAGPSPREFAGIAYDSTLGYLVLFGGGQISISGSVTAIYHDTWKFSAGAWTNITGTGPSPGSFAGMAYDSVDGYIVLFGGISTTAILGDTWKFESLAAATPPIPVAGCQVLGSKGSMYVLTGSIAANSNINDGFGNEFTCILITAPNVTFDLNGFNITDVRTSGDDCCAVMIDSVNDTINGPGTISGTYSGIRVAPHPSFVPITACSPLSNGGLSCDQNATIQHLTFRGGAGVSFSDSICGLLSCTPYRSDDNQVLNNRMTDCDTGVQISGSGNVIAGNIITESRGAGINMYYSSGNTIYDNIFGNAQNVAQGSALGTNYWNITKRAGPNIVGGPYIGGNFWGDYNGTDADGDGFGDTFVPYNANGIIGGVGDQLPLFTDGFALAVKPEMVGPVPAGASGFSEVTISSVTTFSGDVSFSLLPSAGLTASLDRTSLILTSGGFNETKLTVGAATPGDYTLTITANIGGITHSARVSVMVVPAHHPTSISFSCAPSTVATGAPATCTTTVDDTSTSPSTPVGFVAFTLVSGRGVFSSSLCTLSGSGSSASCEVTYTSSEVPDNGVTETLSAAYGGDSSHTFSVSTTFLLSIVQRVTISSLTCLPSSVRVAESSLCTVTVTDVSPGTSPGPLSGSGVSFNSNGLGTFTSSYPVQNVCVLVGSDPSASCSVNYTPSNVGSGTHTISTGYSDHYHAASFSNFNLTVTTAALITTAASVSCDTPVVVNQASICTATVTETSAAGTTSPSGTVSFSTTLSVLGSFDSTTCILVAGTTGTASCSVHFNPLRYDLGPVSVSASYGGDSNHNGSSSSVFSITVNGRTASTTVICDSPVSLAVPPNPSICTITVTDTDARGTPLTPYGHVDLSTNSTGTFSTLTSQCELGGSGVSGSCTIIYSPTVAGLHRITASHPNDGYHLPSSGFFDITVSGKATPTIASVVTPSSIIIGGSASDLATVSGGSSPIGTMTYTAYNDSACTNLAFTSSSIPAGTPSASFTPSTAGTYLWIASYSGDANNNAVTTTCGAAGETLIVSQASPSISSTVTPASVNLGGSASDLASLTGGLSPSGTVTYTAYSDSACTALVFTSANVPLGTSSAAYTPSSPGTYQWVASYNGDVNNNAASTICGASGETLTVVTAPDFALTPTSTTVTFAANSLASDKLRVDAMNGFTGTVSFLRVGSPLGGVSYSCSSVTLSLTIVSANSTCTFSSNTPGTYTAIVNGTGGTPPVFHLVTYTVVVVKNTPSIHTALSASTITVGESVTDSATLTGTDLLTASGTVTYQFFSGSSCVGTATAVGTPVVVYSGVIPTSISQTFNSDGSYSWNAVYSGDANNSGATSPCEPLTVNKASLTLVTLLSSTSITVGNTVSDSATVTGGFQASGTVAYSVFSNNLCTAPGKIVSTVAIAEGVVPNSRLVTFNSTGEFGFQASYGGDANNSGATSPCEPLSVTTAGQPVLLSFKGFDLDDYDNGLGQLQVFVNGHLVVDIPAGLSHLSGSGDYTSFTDRWVNFGPFDITSFVVNGQNNVTFSDLNPADHFGLVRNVMIVRGTTVLLNVGRTFGIYPGHSKTYTFSIPPLTITSFAFSPAAAASKQVLTFTATYTGGTAPFTCIFRFGDGESVTVAGSFGTCTVPHEYNRPGSFMVTVAVRGSSTSDIIRSSLTIDVT